MHALSPGTGSGPYCIPPSLPAQIMTELIVFVISNSVGKRGRTHRVRTLLRSPADRHLSILLPLLGSSLDATESICAVVKAARQYCTKEGVFGGTKGGSGAGRHVRAGRQAGRLSGCRCRLARTSRLPSY